MTSLTRRMRGALLGGSLAVAVLLGPNSSPVQARDYAPLSRTFSPPRVVDIDEEEEDLQDDREAPPKRRMRRTQSESDTQNQTRSNTARREPAVRADYRSSSSKTDAKRSNSRASYEKTSSEPRRMPKSRAGVMSSRTGDYRQSAPGRRAPVEQRDRLFGERDRYSDGRGRPGNYDQNVSRADYHAPARRPGPNPPQRRPQQRPRSFFDHFNRRVRQAAYGAPSRPDRYNGRRPMRPTSARRTYYQEGADSMPPEEIQGPVYDGELEPYPEWDGYPGEYGGCDDCGGCGECDACCGAYGGCNWLWYENLEVFAGGHSFKGPLDLGRNGNFGLGYGVNWGGPLWNALSVGYQVGFQAVHSNFYGDQILDPLGNDARNQYFITTGLFHRPRHGHLQYGLVLDWLQDEYYVDAQLSQIRAEISLLGAWSNEIGFRATGGTGEDDILPTLGVGTSERWEPTDQYVFFIRRRFCSTGAEGRLWAGFTGDSAGLFGGDFRMPLSPSLAMQVNFNALFPDEDPGPIGAAKEAWGGTINLVWYPGATAQSATRSLWRPLFTVADNSSMFFDRKSINP